MQATPTKAHLQPMATAQCVLLSADTGHTDQGLLTACQLTQATLTKACSQLLSADTGHTDQGLLTASSSSTVNSDSTMSIKLLSVDTGRTGSHQALQFTATAQRALLSADTGLLTASGRGNPRTQKHGQLKLSALGFKPPFLGRDAHPSC